MYLFNPLNVEERLRIQAVQTFNVQFQFNVFLPINPHLLPINENHLSSEWGITIHTLS